MSNEELVAEIRAGALERMGELWEQVEGLVKWKAKRIMTALELRGNMCGVDFDDLVQCGYPAMVAAVESYSPENGSFSRWLMYHLQTEFAEATGYRTMKGQNEPLNASLSLSKPLSDEADGAVLGDYIQDRKATATMEAIEEREYLKELCVAMAEALEDLPEDCGEILRLRYYNGLTQEATGAALSMDGGKVRRLEHGGLKKLRAPKWQKRLRPFYDFDYFSGTGLSAFRNSGMSVQEKFVIKKDR